MPFDPDHSMEGKKKKEDALFWKRLTYNYADDQPYERALVEMLAVIYKDHDESKYEKK